ncbi:tetratricopeptide repeat protein [Microcoleus vaginatus]|uniref:tetratricopeptide repeat protein n=1 Tax=Microcoleus vaginatus TaxID=119532 RepID=UPI001F60F473
MSNQSNIIPFPLNNQSSNSSTVEIYSYDEPNPKAIILKSELSASEAEEKQRKDHFNRSVMITNLNAAKPLYSLGKALAKKGEWEKAIASYRKALEIDYQAAEIYQNLGEALVQTKQFDEAVTVYRKAIEIQPDLWEVHHNLGDICQGQGRLEEAVAAYRLAIEFNPDFSWSHNNLGDVLIKQEKWEEAAVAYGRAIELNPDFHWSYYNLGEALMELQRWEEAIGAYRRAIELNSDLPLVHEKLADALQQQSRLYSKEAVSLYYKTIEQNPDDVELYHKLLEIKPDAPQLYCQLANALVRRREYQEAIIFYQMALHIKPDEIEASFQLAKLLQKRNNFEGTFQGIPCSSDIYELWLQENSPKPEDFRQMAEQVKVFKYQPRISIIMPVYNTPKELLQEAIESVLAQVYPHWELCIADDTSTKPYIKEVLANYAAKDERIKVVFRSKNGHISASSNSALEVATGEFIALLDHDDILAPEALYEMAFFLNQHPEADMIYSDEDKLNEQGKRTDPFFKPDWCPDSFLSRMYTCHLGVYRHSLVKQVGGFRLGYEGSQDYDLVLRVTEKTDKIFHIPKVLYHWRIHSESTAGNHGAKSYAEQAATKALTEAVERRGEKCSKIVSPPESPGVYIIRYQIPEYKLISIIIPTRNLGNILDRCLKSIFEKSTYPNYEVIVIDNGSDEPETAAIIAAWKCLEPNRFKCYEYNIPFNYSRINNYAVTKAKGDYLLFLNNDTEVITSDWLEAMVEQAQRPTIGAVGALLLYPDNTVQHAGVVMGVGGVAGHSHKHFPASHQGYVSQLASVNNYSAVTAACLMCRREVFEKVGGFEELLSVAFNDVDLCLNMVTHGYRNIYLPHVILYHYESKSRGQEDTPEKQRRFQQETEKMQQKWGHLIEQDPCYNPNFSREQENYSLRIVTIVDILAVSSLENPCELWAFSIDSPAPETQINSSSIIVAGWIVGKTSPAVAVELICDGQVIEAIAIDGNRSDVAQIFPQAPWGEKSGFSAILKVIGLPDEAELTLEAVLEDGSRVILGTVLLKYQIKSC